MAKIYLDFTASVTVKGRIISDDETSLRSIQDEIQVSVQNLLRSTLVTDDNMIAKITTVIPALN